MLAVPALDRLDVSTEVLEELPSGRGNVPIERVANRTPLQSSGDASLGGHFYLILNTCLTNQGSAGF